MLANFFDWAQPSCSIILHLCEAIEGSATATATVIAKTQSSRKPKSRPRFESEILFSTPDPLFQMQKKKCKKHNAPDPFRQAKRSLLFVNCAGERSQFALIFHRTCPPGRIDFLTTQTILRAGTERERELKRVQRLATMPMTIVCLTNTLIFFNFVWHFLTVFAIVF